MSIMRGKKFYNIACSIKSVHKIKHGRDERQFRKTVLQKNLETYKKFLRKNAYILNDVHKQNPHFSFIIHDHFQQDTQMTEV